MSVWDNPSYAIEPLRNATNNYPRLHLGTIPEEFRGIANFKFGDCGEYHPDKSNKNAFEYFKENVEAWKAFVNGCTKRTTLSESVEFRSTVSQANIRYAGIRSVYWAYKMFSTGEWDFEERLDYEDARKTVHYIYALNAPASRINEREWEKYFRDTYVDEKEDWVVQAARADAVDHIWTLNRNPMYKSMRSKKEIIRKRFGISQLKKIEVGDEPDGLIEYESYISTFRLTGRKALDPKAISKSYNEARDKVLAGETLSEKDAAAISIMPYKEYPRKNSMLLIFRFTGGYILYDRRSDVGGIFFSKDHERLVQMLKSRGKLLMYYSKYDTEDKSLCALMRDSYKKIESLFFESYKLDDPEWANKVCRAFDVCQFAYLAELASDMSDRAIVDQMNKVKREKLDEVIPVKKVLEVVRNESLGVKESLELLKFYKIFPCPDFCIHSVIATAKKKSDEKHEFDMEIDLGKHRVTGRDIKTSKREFWNYIMRNKALTFFDVHKRLPGQLKEIDLETESYPTHLLAYPNISLEALRVDDMEWIDMKGTFPYRKYEGCEEELVKDKTTAPKNRAEVDNLNDDPSFVPKFYARNQVLQYIFDPKFMSQRAATEAIMGDDAIKLLEIQVALKAEAKKPGSRAFMMATDPARRVLSEFETNVAQYVTKQKGSSQGKDDMTLNEKLDVLAETPCSALMTFMMSFDIESFSPKQAKEFKRLGYEVWSHVFGEEHIMSVHKIFTQGRLRFQKFDVDDQFDLDGDDLEGFNGRMNTGMHCDLMGYCVYKLKQMGWVEANAELETLIDDGLLRLQIKEIDDGESTGWKTCVDIIERIYMGAGLKISWDKTFVSQVLCQYLNRVWYDGVEITPGAKAFLRIGKPSTTTVPNLADDIQNLAASTRGAIKSGSDHRLAFLAYTFEAYLIIRKWSGYRSDLSKSGNLPFMTYVPVGLGGLGLPSLAGLSMNETYVSIQAGLANMRQIVWSYRIFETLANKIINSPLRHMDSDAILRAPHSIRTVFRTLNTRRFANAAKSIVCKKAVNPFFTALVQADLAGKGDFAVMTIESNQIVNEIQRERLLKMSPSAFIDKMIGKLQTSGTAAKVLGLRKCAEITMQNKSEAKQLISEMISGKLVRRA